MSRADVAAAILAGGRATRYGGRDKAFIEVEGEPLIDRQLRALRGLVGEVLVVTDRPASFRGYPVRAIADRYPGSGPLAGLDAALAAASAPRVLLLACDMPDVSPRIAQLLLQRADVGADVVVPVVAGSIEPLFAVYGAPIAPLVARRIEAQRLRVKDLPDAAEREGHKIARVPEGELAALDPSLRSFANLNEPADRARRMP